jgi:hypothetical protein
MLRIELSLDSFNLIFAIRFDGIVQDKLCHFHGRDETMNVLERHGDKLMILR